MRAVPSAASLPDIADLLARLHRHKAAAYGDAWRKRGEVISIFANLARKYDRLTKALPEDTPATAEPLIDTVADLCVYASKYLTWLAETQPAAFATVAPGLDPSRASAQNEAAGLEAVLSALGDWEVATANQPPRDVEEAAVRIRTAFEELEAALIAQSEDTPSGAFSAERKVELGWALTAASLRLLEQLAAEDPRRLDPLREEVAAMEGTHRTSSDFTDEIISRTLAAIAAQAGGHVALIGASGTALRLHGVLADAGLSDQVTGIYDEREGTEPPFRPLDQLGEGDPQLLVICADAEKEDLLRAARDHLGVLRGPPPEVVIAGTGHLEFRDALFAELDAPALVPSYATGSPHTRVHLFQCLQAAADHGLRGAIVEFGAFKGGTTAWLARVAKRLGLDAKVIGFDTWDGFPARQSLLDLYTHPRCVFTDLEAVRAYTEPYGVELVPGDITETYERLRGEPLALCFFDTDNYSPTQAALELCVEELVPGGAIVFDHVATSAEYVDTIGERVAAYELLADRPLLHLHGTGVFIKLGA